MDIGTQMATGIFAILRPSQQAQDFWQALDAALAEVEQEERGEEPEQPSQLEASA